MSDPRTALIVGAAPVPGEEAHYARVIRGAEQVIAADAGLLLCLRSGRVPEVCVGDFDSTPAASLAEAEAAGSRVERYPADKDESDLDLAISVARSTGVRRVQLTAAYAGRMDHTLAALGTTLRAADLWAEADEPGWIGYALRADGRACVDLRADPGTVISVIALDGPARVSERGMRYPLINAVLEPLSSLGLSNIASQASQMVEVHAGGVLVIVNRPSAMPPLQSGLVGADTL